MNYFNNKANEKGMFYWDVELDHEARMSNFFFGEMEDHDWIRIHLEMLLCLMPLTG